MTAKSNAQNQSKYRETRASSGKKEIRHVISSEIAEQLYKAVENGETVEGIIKKGLGKVKKPKITREVTRKETNSVIIPKRNALGQVIKG